MLHHRLQLRLVHRQPNHSQQKLCHRPKRLRYSAYIILRYLILINLKLKLMRRKKILPLDRYCLPQLVFYSKQWQCPHIPPTQRETLDGQINIGHLSSVSSLHLSAGLQRPLRLFEIEMQLAVRHRVFTSRIDVSQLLLRQVGWTLSRSQQQ